MRSGYLALCAVFAMTTVNAQDNPVFTIDSNGSDIVTMAVFSDVTSFQIEIVLADPITTGVYDNPELVEVNYSVAGTLTMGTPSGFPQFSLVRNMTGTEFYAQGSSLQFEVAADAFVDDDVNAAELVGTGSDVVFRFDAREVDNGRFHPPVLELRADGTGRIQNSNNVRTSNPLEEVDFGEEYITDFTYIPAEFTILTTTPITPVDPPAQPGPLGGTGGGAAGLGGVGALLLLTLLTGRRQRRV